VKPHSKGLNFLIKSDVFSNIKIKNRGVSLIKVFIFKSFAKNPEKGGQAGQVSLIPQINIIKLHK
jgi:hypothetical protein